MGKVYGVLLTAISIQESEQGHLEGVIHVENLVRQLNSLETNATGVIRFTCEKRRTPSPTGRHTHMGAIVKKAVHFSPKHTPDINTPTPITEDQHEVDKW